MSLLDDVSIVVTPNGYKAGELYAVIPVPTEGADVVENGDFSDGEDDWFFSAECEVVNDQARIYSSDGGFQYIRQSTILNTLKRYKLEFDVISSNGAELGITGGDNVTTSVLGKKTVYITPISTYLQINRSSGVTDVVIDNVTVKEYTSADMDVTRATAATRVDENGLVNYAEVIGGEEVDNGDFATDSVWAKGVGWTISGGTAISDGTQVANSSLASSLMSVTSGILLKVVINIDAASSGVRLYDSNGVVDYGMAVGENVYYRTAPSSSYTLTIISFVGSTATINNVSVKEIQRDNVPRIDYTGGGCPHILAEPQRTNLYPYSNDTTTWSKSNFTATNNYATSPDGTQNAFRGVSTSNASLLYISGSGSAGTNTISIYAKSNTASDQKFRFFGNGNTTQSTDKTATQEWQRFEYTATYSAVTWGLRGASVSGTNDILFYGMQHEVGSYATSYIPTSGSTVTRNQDIFTRDGIGSLINSTEGVLFVEISGFENDAISRAISLSDGTTSNRINLFFSSDQTQVIGRVSSGGVTVADMIYSGITQTLYNKIAVKWKLNDFALWVNGVEVLTDSSGAAPIGLNRLGFDNASTAIFLGKVKQLQVYDTALTDVQLAALTS